jgi:hypothetical protein
MYDIFDRVVNSGEIIPVLSIIAVFGTILLVTLTGAITRCVYKIRADATAAQLKQDMLDRGMSAEEIKMVLEAGPPK